MKILLVQESDWFEKGPAQQHHLMEKLSSRSHEIRVIDYEILWRTHAEKEVRSRRQVFDNGAKVCGGAGIIVVRPGMIKIPFLDYGSVLFSHNKEIRRQIDEFAPDVIVGFGILNAWLASRAAKRNDTPFIYYWIDVLHRLLPFRPFQPIAKLLEKRTLRAADRVLVINDKLRDYVVKIGAPAELTQVVRGGIDTIQFCPTAYDSTMRERYGLHKGDVVLFFVGWLYEFSGLKEVALQLAESRNCNVKLLIVGEGDAYQELSRMRHSHDLEDRLILTGKKPYQELPGLIAASDICLLPAYPGEKIMQDIVPIKMYEYMAMGKPVIATRLPGVMKEFGEGNGVVYVDRPEDVVAKAIELMRSGSVEGLGLKARSYVENNSWATITDTFELILEETIRRKRQQDA